MSGHMAVVTGAARGLGAGIAERLAEDFDVVVLADLRGDDAQRTAEELARASGKRAIARACEVSDAGAVRDLYATLPDDVELTGLVNVAGVGMFTDLLDIDPDLWDRVFAVNTRGTFLVTQEFVRRAAPPAAIVNISSIGARAGNEMLSHYGAAKAAVIAFGHSVARRCARQGIRSNTVMPGVIYTDMWRDTIAFLRTQDPSLEGVDDETAFAGIVDGMVPMGRPQEPRDVAEAVAFLIGDRARNITGQTIAVDGGTVLT